MESKKAITVDCLTDDLVVEILSRVPPKSFCRFKCVCKAWLAFSSDPHYRQKLPKISTGLLYQAQYSSDIHLVGMSPNDEETDGALTFMPQYKQLELVDCCNGLVLCRYKSSYTSADTCRFTVCNPATREWRTLPILNTPHGSNVSRYTAFLAFDPSWSGQFYVFNFQEKLKTPCHLLSANLRCSRLTYVSGLWMMHGVGTIG
uniref:F-box domain-containing protein n=1 Tax=Triticum urartu TaxID=4572 RepID=A0A8R7P825_TRIUA